MVKNIRLLGMAPWSKPPVPAQVLTCLPSVPLAAHDPQKDAAHGTQEAGQVLNWAGRLGVEGAIGHVIPPVRHNQGADQCVNAPREAS